MSGELIEMTCAACGLLLEEQTGRKQLTDDSISSLSRGNSGCIRS